MTSMMDHRCALAAALALAACASTGAPPCETSATSTSTSATQLAATSTASDPAAPEPVATSTVPHVRIRFPLFSTHFDDTPVAAVEGEVIRMSALRDALAMAHQERQGATSAGRFDVSAILDRLIGVKLMIHEARQIGLDELPEFKKEIEKFKEMRLREVLKREVVEGLKVDEALAQKTYEDLVREWKLRSILFNTEDAAAEMKRSVARGADFEKLGAEVLADKRATAIAEGHFLAADSMLPQVREAVSAMAVGDVSDPIKTPQGFALLRVEEMRYPEKPDVRARSRQTTLEVQARELLEAFVSGLAKKHTRDRGARIKALDLDAPKPGFEALQKDKRVLITISGEAPIRVMDLANAIAAKLFHGVPSTKEAQKLTRKKYPMLRGMLTKRLLRKEAVRRGLQDSETYRAAIDEFSDSLLVNLFISRAVEPSVNVTEQDAKQYFEENIERFSFPEFYALQGICFPQRPLAEAALAELQRGTQLRWLLANAEGQTPAEVQQLAFGGNLVSGGALDSALRALLKDANKGDSVLYEGPDKLFYVIQLAGRVEAKAQPYAGARSTVVKAVYSQKLNAALGEWIGKLREGYDVSVYLRGLGG